MTDEIIDKIAHRDKIVQERDIDALFLLPEDDYFSIALCEILNNKCDFKPQTLNPAQRVLFLCMHLENAGQADHILGFLQESYPAYANEAVHALNEIGATNSAILISKAIDLLPKDGSWFFDSADEDKQEKMDKIDWEFSGYPDGFLRPLYRKYAEKNRNQL